MPTQVLLNSLTYSTGCIPPPLLPWPWLTPTLAPFHPAAAAGVGQVCYDMFGKTVVVVGGEWAPDVECGGALEGPLAEPDVDWCGDRCLAI